MTYEIFNEAIRVLESKGVVFLETKPVYVTSTEQAVTAVQVLVIVQCMCLQCLEP